METAPETTPTVREMLEQFVPVHFPKLARRTQIDGLRHVEILCELWGDLPADQLTPRTIGRWMNGGPTYGKIQRGKIISVLSTAYKYAVGEFFTVESNPCRDLRFPKANKRTRYVTHEEFEAVRAICSTRLRAAMELAYISGQRQGDLLKLKWDHIEWKGTDPDQQKVVHLRQGKTGKRFGIIVSKAMHEIFMRCKRHTPDFPKDYVLRNKDGNRYTSEGFRTMWQRTMKKALALGVIKEPFTFHDLRAKTASDHPDIERAAKLLGHQNSQMTKSVYDRNIRLVEALK